MKAEEFDRAFDRGEDVSSALYPAAAQRPGLEQRRVNVDFPEPGAVTPETEDPLAYAQDLQGERCVLFVACTRARDHLHVSGVGEPSPFLLGRTIRWRPQPARPAGPGL